MNETPDPYQQLQTLTRRRVRLVWEMAQLGGTLSDEDARLVNAMREHSEYADLWGHLDELSDEQIERDGTNPLLHVTIHQTIENQLAGGEPAEVGRAVTTLMRQGLSRHEAIHRVGAVLADEIWGILHEQRPFDEPAFTRKLREAVEASASRRSPPRLRPTRKKRR